MGAWQYNSINLNDMNLTDKNKDDSEWIVMLALAGITVTVIVCLVWTYFF